MVCCAVLHYVLQSTYKHTDKHLLNSQHPNSTTPHTIHTKTTTAKHTYREPLHGAFHALAAEPKEPQHTGAPAHPGASEDGNRANANPTTPAPLHVQKTKIHERHMCAPNPYHS